MADGLAREAADGARISRGLTYPFDLPEPGEAVTVAPGVLWMRLPLPFVLNHINVYAVEDGEGWALVDTGLDTSLTRAAWEALLAGPLGGRPVTRMICTHLHPDHIGLAGWLCRRFDAPLLMSRLEYVTARMLMADTGAPAPEEGAVFYRAAGFDEARIQRWREGFGQFGRRIQPLPAGFTRLSEGDRLEIGGQVWRVVIGEGHSPEHVCLWREADGVLLAGDQILPRISSNVSVWPTEPEADPLGDWMRSLERLRALLPADLLVLPSHGEPFRGVHARLEALTSGHEKGLSRLRRLLAQPKRTIDVFGALFARAVDDGILEMATGEARAHLNLLERRGQAKRRRDEAGVDWWTAAGGEETDER